MKKILRPYFLVSLCGILAFAPLSLMIRAMKNDVVALEYPINHFISQCIRHGQIPSWFNTWGMGFPLQSNLTWGIFSTPQVVFSSVFNYDIYALHIEFMFFILLAGWGMFYLLRRFFVKDETLALLLAVAYMLSGFMVGSTQWMLYITAAAFVPLLISCLLLLLEKPGLKNAVQTAVCYTLMFTSVYAALNIITTYSLAIYILLRALGWVDGKRLNARQWKALLVSFVLILLFCFPCLYFTMELLQQMERGSGIETGSRFFNSNYLHPGALSTLVFPLSSLKMSFPNTEGTMLNTYAGLMVPGILVFAIRQAWRSRNKTAILLLGASLLYLIISFGAFTPVRNSLNQLPGFSYFRNPAIFRFYFLLALILFLASALRDLSFQQIMVSRMVRFSFISLAVICLIVIGTQVNSFHELSFSSADEFVKTMTNNKAVLMSALLQLLILTAVILACRRKTWRLAQAVLLFDLVINTLLCTPFFSVSSYSLPQVNGILKSVPGFPVQLRGPFAVPASLTDSRGNNWQNVNVFSKEVSAMESYRGPLILKTKGKEDSTIAGRPLVFCSGATNSSAVIVLIQKPAHVRARIQAETADSVTLLQNYYEGWKVFVNNKRSPITRAARPGISVQVPAGVSIVDFVYDRKQAWLPALLLHILFLGLCFVKLLQEGGKLFTRSSSPS